MVAKSKVKEMRADFVKARQGKMSYVSLNDKWERELICKNGVFLRDKLYSSSGKYEVNWSKGKMCYIEGQVKMFGRIDEAFKFAEEKALKLGEQTNFTSNISNKKYYGIWIVLGGKLEKYY